MRKCKYLLVVSLFAVMIFALAGCGSSGASSSAGSASQASTSASTTVSKVNLAPGEYTVKFDTDSSMFHVNEALEGKGTLTVANDGSATVHVSLASKKITNLFPGTAAQAQAPGAALLQPTTDTVTYSDGTTEEVYGFDIPVPVLEEQFDVALIGEKGKWYDHKVSVSNPIAK